MRRAVVVAVSVTAVGLGAAPVAAEFCPTHFRSEQDILDVSASCRATYLVDAGVGNYSTHEQLWRERALYRSLGYNDDYLVWARVETVTITADSPEYWGHCVDTTRAPGQPCPPGMVEYTRVAANFSRLPVTLRVLKAGDAVIYLGCGNDGDEHVEVPAVAPTLTGVKFDDANRNGVRDAGEELLPGVQVTLVRESSLADEHAGPVDTAVTDANGRYTFSMRGSRPGSYRIDETVPTGWRQTTASPRVELGWGAGDGVIDVDAIGNTRVADIAKVAFEVVTPPARLERGQETEFVVRATLANLGPYPEVGATDMLDVVPPHDCSATVLDQGRMVTLRTGEPVTVDFHVRTTCDHRSDHMWTFHDRLIPHAGYEDPDLANNKRSTSLSRPVFEQVDVSVTSPAITCTRPQSPTRYECAVTATIANARSATPLAATATTTLTSTPDCVITNPVTTGYVLASGESATVGASFIADCAPGAHSFVAVVEVREDEVHGEEADASDNTTRVRWAQTDVKPNSDPSSINLDKTGVVPVAILSTPDFDAVRQVVVAVDSLRFGATGTERSLIGCATAGEDVNGDGLADLVCRFDTATAAFTCETTSAPLVGVLIDGTRFESVDAVKITPCRAH